MKKNSSKLLTALIVSAAFLIILSIILSTGGKTDAPSEKDEQEKALAAFLENGKGVGKTSVSLCYAPDGRISGAAVVCEGGNDPNVRAEITRLLAAALGIGTNRIYVSEAT